MPPLYLNSGSPIITSNLTSIYKRGTECGNHSGTFIGGMIVMGILCAISLLFLGWKWGVRYAVNQVRGMMPKDPLIRSWIEHRLGCKLKELDIYPLDEVSPLCGGTGRPWGGLRSRGYRARTLYWEGIYPRNVYAEYYLGRDGRLGFPEGPYMGPSIPPGASSNPKSYRPQINKSKCLCIFLSTNMPPILHSQNTSICRYHRYPKLPPIYEKQKVWGTLPVDLRSLPQIHQDEIEEAKAKENVPKENFLMLENHADICKAQKRAESTEQITSS